MSLLVCQAFPVTFGMSLSNYRCTLSTCLPPQCFASAPCCKYNATNPASYNCTGANLRGGVVAMFWALI